MISYKTFERAMNFMIRANKLDTDLNAILGDNYPVVGDTLVSFSYPNSVIIDVLNDAMGLKDIGRDETDLEYWCYERDFGNDFQTGNILNEWLPKDHKYHTPKLDTLRELYDYLVFLSKEYNKADC